MNNDRYRRHILALDDSQLESFILDWIKCKTALYADNARFSGAGDMGRDVVGFLTNKRHEGDWHNYQCKQLGRRLPTAAALHELGKILYYAWKQEFTVPTKYFFVAPKGLNRNLEKLVYNPASFKRELISKWDEYCATTIIKNTVIPLEGDLLAFIQAFDFGCIYRVAIDELLTDEAVGPVLFNWFGAELPQAPKGQAPAEVQTFELQYITQLTDAYSERNGKVFSSISDVLGTTEYGPHLMMQRERFFDADSFKRFYRDNTPAAVLQDLERDVFHGIYDVHHATHSDSLARADAVMQQAALVSPGGVLAQYLRTTVKQGVCHHFVNDGRLKWKR